MRLGVCGGTASLERTPSRCSQAGLRWPSTLRPVNRASRPASLPLARLLSHTADAVQAVLAGRSLNDVLARCPLEARPGTQALSFHVLRWLGSAQAVRELLAPKPPAAEVDALLLSALALLWPAGDPPYAEHTLVDQAVTAARQRARASAPFINAVLRRFVRERDALVRAAQQSILGRYNHPAWWIDRLRHDWPTQWEAIIEANNRRPPMTLRVNARRTSAAAYVARLGAEGITATVLSRQAVVLDQPVPVERLPGFAEGLVSVQDAAAQRAAPLLIGDGLRPGARVLDACAAPGGKTAHLLELADLDVTAVDSDPERLSRVSQTLTRLSLSAQTIAADAARPASWWGGELFDAILIDAPCSASGIVRRHPDVRWLRRPTDIPALVTTQTRLLDRLWPLLAAGGRFLYCTCSVFRAEGEAQIDAFLQRRPEASLIRGPAAAGHLLPLPDNADNAFAAADGFFYALLVKD